MTLRERAKQLKTDVPALWFALQKKETPLIAKVCAGAAVAYALSPIDLVPDFIPVLGYLDDVVILPALVALAVRLVPKDIFAQCQVEAQGIWRKDSPKKWLFALPVAALWFLLLFLLIQAVWL